LKNWRQEIFNFISVQTHQFRVRHPLRTMILAGEQYKVWRHIFVEFTHFYTELTLSGEASSPIRGLAKLALSKTGLS
jgi:hypothetical protein